MKCPNCRSEIPKSCLRCPYCNSLISNGYTNTRYNTTTEPIYNGERYQGYYSDQTKYSGKENRYTQMYYQGGNPEYEYTNGYYVAGQNKQKRVTDISHILFSMGVLIIGIQIIILMILVVLLIQL